MRSKTIKLVLERKMNEWIDSIDNDRVKKLARENAMVTGGCITSMLLGDDVNDFDIYFKTREAAEAVAVYYSRMFETLNPGAPLVDVLTTDTPAVEMVEDEIIGSFTDSRVYLYIKSYGIASEDGVVLDDAVESVMDVPVPQKSQNAHVPFRPLFFSSNAITLSDKIQLVMRFTGDIGEIHDTYDFAHCKCYYDHDERKLVLPPESLECILGKQLIYTGSKYPVCSIIRTRKFIERGWKITAGEYIKMAFQVSELDLSNIDVLADQLVGVDSAYFTDLITQLRTTAANDSGFSYGSEYISKIVDIVFNGKVHYS